jgi:hypothetical protein
MRGYNARLALPCFSNTNKAQDYEAAMARYKDAIDWIAQNDDTTWVDIPNDPISIRGALVADLFRKSDAQVRKDLRRAVAEDIKRRPTIAVLTASDQCKHIR